MNIKIIIGFAIAFIISLNIYNIPFNQEEKVIEPPEFKIDQNNIEIKKLNKVLSDALGKNVDLSISDINYGAGSLVFGFDDSGILINITDRKALNDKVEHLLKVVFNKKTGDWVTKFEHNGNLLGYALFDCDSHNDYSRIAQAILENLGLEIKKISNKGGDLWLMIKL